MSKLKLGVLVGLGHDPEVELKKVRDLGLDSCQIACWDMSLYTDANVAKVKAAAQKYGVEVTTIWAGYSGPEEWNFTGGASTIGLVPPQFRDQRVKDLKQGADFAKACGVRSITTHAGFIPENPSDPLYQPTIAALREVAQHCKKLGIEFWFETGQETPITLRRAMKDIGTGNLGINLDPANLLMYGKANPVDALDIIGPFVKGVHAKDGTYPNGDDPDKLGVEKPLGEGRVNFPVLVPKLKNMGFTGALTIEREISGDQQIVDIKRAIEILSPLT